jgi:hypothetical protein
MAPGFLPKLFGRLERKRRRERRKDRAIPVDLQSDAKFVAAYERCRAFTMTSAERMYALWSAAHHVVAAGVAGDFVECGVWKGGSSMMAALALADAGDTTRPLWLFDTFEGMSEPTGDDVDHKGHDARPEWEAAKRRGEGWCASPLDDVRAALATTGAARERLHFVVGKVETTIPREIPEKIALLRLDTDWYESTKHELLHLWPRLARGGVLIFDDYGHWAGARRAVDEFLATQKPPLLLDRIDYTGRITLKP